MKLREKVNELLANMEEGDFWYYSYILFFSVFTIGHLVILCKVWL